MMWRILPWLLAIPLCGEIVDRVAVSFGTEVITASELDERIRLTAFQNRTTPVFNPANRKQAAEQLIDQRFVMREMQLGHYSALAEADAAVLLANYVKATYPQPADFPKALADAGLKPSQLQADLARQADLLTFLNLRFRPAVQVTEEDIRKYYSDRVDQKTAYNDVRSVIEEALTAARADQELDLWLKDQRRRVKIEYHPEAFGGKVP